MRTYPYNQITAKAGIGLRSQHYIEVLETMPDVAWFEVHSENFFGDGGMAMHVLEKVRENYPLSLHGVGLSLGSAQEPDKKHLKKLKNLIDRFNPALVSEHISWSAVGGNYLNDLLPLPYTEESLGFLCRNINIMQDYIGRQVLVENPSTYLQFEQSEMDEPHFINRVIEKTGCGLLLDVNNIYVSGQNHDSDPYKYIDDINKAAVGEIHLAGHATKEIEGYKILIDNHGSEVIQPVWDLYAYAIEKLGKVPTLIEWDTEIPEFNILQQEAEKANIILLQENIIQAKSGIR